MIFYSSIITAYERGRGGPSIWERSSHSLQQLQRLSNVSHGIQCLRFVWMEIIEYTVPTFNAIFPPGIPRTMVPSFCPLRKCNWSTTQPDMELSTHVPWTFDLALMNQRNKNKKIRTIRNLSLTPTYTFLKFHKRFKNTQALALRILFKFLYRFKALIPPWFNSGSYLVFSYFGSILWIWFIFMKVSSFYYFIRNYV